MNFCDLKNKNKTVTLIFLLIFLIIISNFSGFNYGFEDKSISTLEDNNVNHILFQQEENSSSSEEVDFISSILNQYSMNNWKENFLKEDQNRNGISDNFEDKLNSLTKSSASEESASIKNSISYDKIPIIVQFPETDYTSAASLFKNFGGNIKSEYKEAINGFAGEIDYEGIIQFSETFRNLGTPFLIEEDSIVEANLYYVSRNMNLRPYVWKNLSYTGDKYSSIAIIDTGIDDTHNFFTPGYSNISFDHKIVGWRDEVNGEILPYDDHGHGSHCSGIATGEGLPNYDGDGRSVATSSLAFDSFDWYDDEDFNTTVAVFNVTEAGDIAIDCDFNDFTPGVDQVHIRVSLLHNNEVKSSYKELANNWASSIVYEVNNSNLGTYTLKLGIDFDDNNGDLIIDEPNMRVRTVLHWPFNPPLFNSGDAWQGVAPDTHLVGVKVLDENGRGYTSDIIDGIEWVIVNKEIYNITTISMSLGGGGGYLPMIEAVNNAVENGIVTVVAAGNSGGDDENEIGSPGDADNVITVAAMSIMDNVAEYSSSGGDSYTGLTKKPDIMAPGGSWTDLMMFSADTNDNDAKGEYSTDGYLNDMYPAVGTSMATPAVAGATNLLIEAMGGHQNWNYTASEAKTVKALLLMTATETYPIIREYDEDRDYSPVLNRGGKDKEEGYGRLNVDAALEVLTQELAPTSNISAWLTSSVIDPFKKHALGSYVKLNSSENYKFTLNVPTGADFDLHLYDKRGSSVGDPIMLASSISSVLGKDEALCYTPTESGNYFLVAKAISGQGMANISFLLNNFAPSLSGDSLIPSSGNQSTLLNFTIIYTDPDDFTPTYLDVIINGTHYPMQKQDDSDENFTDGCQYQLFTYLQPGNYSYNFSCKDGRFSDTTSTVTGLKINKTNEFSPTLNDAQINLDKGFVNETIFIYTINYTDDDNNAPEYVNTSIYSKNYSMYKQDSTDVNYMDGCIYVLNIIHNESWFYNYSFHSHDSDNYVSDGPYYGPVVYNYTNIFEDDFESGLSNWALIEGLWHLTDDNSSWSDPYHSPTHSIWYGQESTGSFTIGENSISGIFSKSFDLSTKETAFLEFYHRLETDDMSDLFAIAVSTEPESFDLNSYYPVALGIGSIDPWQKMKLNISEFCGYDSVRIAFIFIDLYLPEQGDHRGWLIDDIKVISELEPNYYAPRLTSEQLIPTTGNQTTELNFTVTYTDLDNNAPSFINVVINGTVYPMQKQNNNDKDYYDGCQYQFLGYLQPGMYNYIFECADEGFSNSTKVYTDFNITEISGVNSPSLSNNRVNSNIGFQGTTNFIFSVNYTDLDNNAPKSINITITNSQNISTIHPMVKKYFMDTNYMDGCMYIYATLLNILGNYSYYFNCTDGYSLANDGPYIGPLVNVDYGLINYKMTPGYNYEWIDATNASGGVRCDLTDEDDEAQKFYLPFTFRFYDQDFDIIYVSTNGFASFKYEVDFYNEPFPDSSHDYMIAPFWSDLEAGDPCNIFVRNMTNPNYVVIEWLNYESLGGDEIGTFEIILYENGDIVFNYKNITYIDNYDGYTCGLNYGDGSYYNIYTGLYEGMNNFSILFTYVPVLYTLSENGGDDDDDDESEGIIVGYDLFLIIGLVGITTIVLLKKRLKQ